MIHKKQFADIFKKALCSLSEEELNQFYQLYELYEQYNKPFDLSRLFSPVDIIEKHFIDSIILRDFMEIPDSILDIGTGPGFPGIPLKIISPSSYIILGEPRSKRVTFMNMVIEKLNLTDIEVYPHSVTELSSFDVESTITRAVESIDETLSRSLPFLPAQGKAIFLKGPGGLDEIRQISAENEKHFKNILTKTYRLPLSGDDRSLIVFEKTSNFAQSVFRIMKNTEENKGLIISSPDNKKYKAFKKILTPEGIKKSQKTIIAGKKIIHEILLQSSEIIDEIILCDGYTEQNPDLLQFIKHNADRQKVFILKKGLFSELDLFNTGGLLCSISIPDIPVWNEKKSPGLTLLIPFQDPVNIGSVIRSAKGFGAENIVLLKGAAHPYHPKSIRASAGAVINCPLYSGPDINSIAAIAQKENWPVIALNMEGDPIDAIEFQESFMLIAGIEGPGLPENLKPHGVSIPLHNEVESLNASSAAAIALYQWKIHQSPSKSQR